MNLLDFFHRQKRCPHCRKSKALKDFPRDARKPDGRAFSCRACSNGWRRKAKVKKQKTPTKVQHKSDRLMEKPERQQQVKKVPPVTPEPPKKAKSSIIPLQPEDEPSLINQVIDKYQCFIVISASKDKGYKLHIMSKPAIKLKGKDLSALLREALQ